MLRGIDIVEKLIERIRNIASEKVVGDEDDFNPQDYCGGNFDDAFQMGVETGEVWFARELLSIIEKGGDQ